MMTGFARDEVCDDEAIASSSDASLLITAATPHEVDEIALRIHLCSRRALSPLVRVLARDLPVDPGLLADHCGELLEAATGGSLLIDDVEDMPPAVQPVLIELLQRLQRSRKSEPGIRVIAGTTVSLMDLMSAGRFSERLFYRLNVIHVLSSAAEAPLD